MIDVSTKKPLRVSTDGTVGPYIMVPVAQLDELRKLLDDHGVRYWVDDVAISLDDGPEIVLVDLGRSGDAHVVQGLLDGWK